EQRGLVKVAGKLAGKERAATLAARGELAPDLIARHLDEGHVSEAASLWKALKEKSLLDKVPELVGRARGDAAFGALWATDAFAGSAGKPDPLARPAPYVCRLVLA